MCSNSMILETKDVQCGTHQPLVAFGRFKRVDTDTLYSPMARRFQLKMGLLPKFSYFPLLIFVARLDSKY